MALEILNQSTVKEMFSNQYTPKNMKDRKVGPIQGSGCQWEWGG
jgi:hypothetical protein